MSSGTVLVLAMLFLGAIIATVGDRLGTRIGKARLSLFNLRPRRTATLVTIATGIVISASTLGILFAVSDPLRTGVFELRTIQRRLRQTRTELEQARGQKAKIETELAKARSDQAVAKKQLTETNQSLQTAIAERTRAQREITSIQAELQQTRSQFQMVSQQISQMRGEISQLQTERNRVIAERNQEIQGRDAVIRQREAQLKELEQQQTFLAREVRRLELEAKGLRQGNVTVQRGQVLASAVVRIVDPPAARQAVDQLLAEANRTAVELVRPGSTAQIIQITKLEVEKLVDQINDGQDYVVRIFSAANYRLGENTPIQVLADAVRNQSVFKPGDTVASISLDASNLTDQQVQERINFLIEAANFRARSLGILREPAVDIGRIQNLITFVEQVRQSRRPLELRAIAAEPALTAGPVKLEFIAVEKGQTLFRSTTQPQ